MWQIKQLADNKLLWWTSVNISCHKIVKNNVAEDFLKYIYVLWGEKKWRCEHDSRQGVMYYCRNWWTCSVRQGWQRAEEFSFVDFLVFAFYQSKSSCCLLLTFLKPHTQSIQSEISKSVSSKKKHKHILYIFLCKPWCSSGRNETSIKSLTLFKAMKIIVHHFRLFLHVLQRRKHFLFVIHRDESPPMTQPNALQFPEHLLVWQNSALFAELKILHAYYIKLYINKNSCSDKKKIWKYDSDLYVCF